MDSLSDRIEPGDIYEDCAFHPVWCTWVDYSEDEIRGISLLDGTGPRSCSPAHCGPIKLTAREALEIRRDHAAYVIRRTAELEAATQSPSGDGASGLPTGA